MNKIDLFQENIINKAKFKILNTSIYFQLDIIQNHFIYFLKNMDSKIINKKNKL